MEADLILAIEQSQLAPLKENFGDCFWTVGRNNWDIDSGCKDIQMSKETIEKCQEQSSISPLGKRGRKKKAQLMVG